MYTLNGGRQSKRNWLPSSSRTLDLESKRSTRCTVNTSLQLHPFLSARIAVQRSSSTSASAASTRFCSLTRFSFNNNNLRDSLSLSLSLSLSRSLSLSLSLAHSRSLSLSLCVCVCVCVCVYVSVSHSVYISRACYRRTLTWISLSFFAGVCLFGPIAGSKVIFSHSSCP
jgi:hypothetical protein